MYDDIDLGITLVHQDLNTIIAGPRHLIKTNVIFNRYNNEQRVDIDVSEEDQRVCQFTFFVPEPDRLSPDQLGLAEALTAARYASEMQHPVGVVVSNPVPENLDVLLTQYAGVEINFIGDKYKSLKEPACLSGQTVLLSGGLDSAALLMSGKGKFNALTFYHGQPAFTHGQWTEKQAAKKLVEICQEVFGLDTQAQFASHRFRVLKKGKIWAKSFRNLFFALHGSFLQPQNELLLGCHRDDIEHDCNNVLISEFRKLSGVPILMPNINMSRPDIVKGLIESTDLYHPFVYASTQSCQMTRFYGKKHLFCGSCHSCLLRLSAAVYEVDPRFRNFDVSAEVVPEDVPLSFSKAWRNKKFAWPAFNKWWKKLSDLQKEDFLPSVDFIKQLENDKVSVPVRKVLPKDFIVRFVGGNNHVLIKDLEQYKSSGGTVFVPFAGSGREVYCFAQQGKKVIASDTQFLSKCLIQGVLVGSGSTDIDFNIPDFEKGIAVGRKLFRLTEELAGYIDSYALLYHDNLFALAVLANSILSGRCIYRGYISDNSSFLISTVDAFKEILESTCKRLSKYYGTCPGVEFYLGSFEKLCRKTDLVFVDPPKVISDTDIYSETFEGLNSVLAQKDVLLPAWNSDGYFDKFQKIMNQSWDTLLSVYTSDVFPTVSELEEYLGTFGTVTLTKTYRTGKRVDYLFKVCRKE